MLKQKYFEIPDLEGNIELSMDDMDDYRVAYDNLAPLLFQSGYLTIKAYDRECNLYILGYPNDEVRYALLKKLIKVYTSGEAGYEGKLSIAFFRNAMQKGDIDKVLTLTKALMASILYDSLPPDKLFSREHNYQMAIYFIFTLMGEYVRCILLKDALI